MCLFKGTKRRVIFFKSQNNFQPEQFSHHTFLDTYSRYRVKENTLAAIGVDLGEGLGEVDDKRHTYISMTTRTQHVLDPF
jgi:hypothetical protein